MSLDNFKPNGMITRIYYKDPVQTIANSARTSQVCPWQSPRQRPPLNSILCRSFQSLTSQPPSSHSSPMSFTNQLIFILFLFFLSNVVAATTTLMMQDRLRLFQNLSHRHSTLLPSVHYILTLTLFICGLECDIDSLLGENCRWEWFWFSTLSFLCNYFVCIWISRNCF